MRKKQIRATAALCVLLLMGGARAQAAYGVGCVDYAAGDLQELTLTVRDLRLNTGYALDVTAYGDGELQSLWAQKAQTVEQGAQATQLTVLYLAKTNEAKLFTFDTCTLPLTEDEMAGIEGAFTKANQTDRERLYAGVGAAVNAVYRHGSYDTTPRLDALLEKPAPDDGWAVPAACAACGAVLGSAVTAAAFAARGRACRRAAEESAPPKKPE